MTPAANRPAHRGSTSERASRVLENPAEFPLIVAGLGSTAPREAGDCAEVMTKVAEHQPERVVPHAPLLWTLLAHTNGRVRWESMHALALAAGAASQVVGTRTGKLRAIIRQDASVIVRDYAIDAVAAHGRHSAAAARQARAILLEALELWEGKHAARVLSRLRDLVATSPASRVAVGRVAEAYRDHPRSSVRTAARSLLRVLVCVLIVLVLAVSTTGGTKADKGKARPPTEWV